MLENNARILSACKSPPPVLIESALILLVDLRIGVQHLFQTCLLNYNLCIIDMLFIRELLIEAVNFFFFIKYITYLKGVIYITGL